MVFEGDWLTLFFCDARRMLRFIALYRDNYRNEEEHVAWDG